jgi:hypothetical protein
VFREPTDYRVFLHLLEESCDRFEVAIWGYTLLARSYSLILVPESADSLDVAMRRVDSEFAHYHNLRHMARGTVWKGSYQAAPLCWSRVWEAIAFAERKPVREDGLSAAWAHAWSSAGARLGAAPQANWLRLEEWSRHWNVSRWRSRLQISAGEQEFGQQLRAALDEGAPLGEMLAIQEPVLRMGPRRAAGTGGLRSFAAAG